MSDPLDPPAFSDPNELDASPAEQPIKQHLQPCTNCATLLDVSDYELYAQIHCPICGTALRARTQFMHFTILGILGEGGMGTVFRAIDSNLNRPIALKVVKREHSSKPEYIEKFEHEAQITASVNHPNVVKVYSYGSHDGVYYIAMELVDKGTLDQLIGLQGRIAEIQVLEIGGQIAEGLKAAYDCGLIHRDVKPGNILFADAHTGKIVDFGLALLMEDEAAARGEVWGTPYYVAPEKLNHEPEDHRSDIYSLGGTLFHALSGRPPFEAETASMVALKHIKSTAVSLQAFAPDVSSATAYVINRMLAKDPEGRYQTYEELTEHLNYARTELLESLNKPKVQKQRVVVESEESQSILGIITGISVLMVVVLGIGAYVFRDYLFSNEQEREQKKKVEQRKVVNLQAEVIEQSYEDARQTMLTGDFVSAQDAFKKIADEKPKPPLMQWARFHEGLSAYLADQPSEAVTAFRKLAALGLFSEKKEDEVLASFFINASGIVTDPAAVTVYTARNFSNRNVDTLANLVFALKNWHRGDYLSTNEIFSIFLKAKPKAPFEWITEYFPLAEKYMASTGAFVKLEDARKKAESPEENQAVLAQLRQMRDTVELQGKMVEKLSAMELELQQKVAGFSADETKKLAEKRTQLLKTIQEEEAKIRVLVKDGQFAKIRPIVEGLAKDNFVENQRLALSKKADWLVRFKRVLINDINSTGFPEPLTRTNGTKTTGPIKKANDNVIGATTQYGAIEIKWSELPPEALSTMAEYFIKTAKENAQADRQWYAGVYAIFIGQDKLGKQLLLDASQSKDAFKESLPLFFDSQ